MNCRRFQHELYEYLDGSLSPRARAAAEKHLSGCAACRQTLSAERQVAQSLSDEFRRTAGSLQLPPAVQRRVLAALADQRRAPDEEPGHGIFWRRLAWPLAIAASVLLLLAGFFFFLRPPGPGGLIHNRRSPKAGFRSSFPTWCRSTRSAGKADS